MAFTNYHAVKAAALLWCLCAVTASAFENETQEPADEAAAEFAQSVRPILKAFCFSCHSEETAQEGGLTLNDIDPDVADGSDFEIWRIVYDRIRAGEMPPGDSEQPSVKQRAKLLAWISQELLKTQQPHYGNRPELRHPRYGNYVDHSELFHKKPGPVIPGPPRIWRIRADIYRQSFSGSRASNPPHDLSDPFALVREKEFKDYANRQFIDESTTRLLLKNAETIVQEQCQTSLNSLTTAGEQDLQSSAELAIDATFRNVLYRPATADEVQRFTRFYSRLIESNSRQVAAERLLMAIYMQPEVLFREELGTGKLDEHGRVRLSQREIAFALSYTLGSRPNEDLLTAAQNGQLATRQQIIDQVRRLLQSTEAHSLNPRVLQFFREYFGYPYVTKVFKNPPRRGLHLPEMLLSDLDLMVEYIVKRDKDVLFNLLTSREYFVDCERSPRTGELVQFTEQDSHRDPAFRPSTNPQHGSVYGLPVDWIWTAEQPVTLPEHIRRGVLMHPAWLAAWSGNFNNHPVQRGKWIRTRLLGGSVPNVPITVDATVPEDRKKQYRERLVMATASSDCQRCHRKMDPLGLPFEQFDHYGRYRVREVDRPVDSSGFVGCLDDKSVSGAVANPIQLVDKLARSTHVEQVFVRHVFRYLMGRNETLGDAGTLQEAHKAYRDSGGSFQALVVSIIASKSFLYRFAGDAHEQSS